MGATVEQALEQLKSTGVRMTPQRHAILSFLMHSVTHPTADEIYKSLSPTFPSMSVATIYNNLRLFVDAGLIRELTYGDDSSRFDADLSDHYHAICRTCGTIVDFDYPPLTDAEEAATRKPVSSSKDIGWKFTANARDAHASIKLTEARWRMVRDWKRIGTRKG